MKFDIALYANTIFILHFATTTVQITPLYALTWKGFT